jgi:hypothetical protein
MNISKHKKTTLINELTASTFSAPPWSQKADDVIKGVLQVFSRMDCLPNA